MFALPFIRRTVHGLGATLARHKTERLLRALPMEIRKDIGWPEADDRRTAALEAASANCLGMADGRC